MSGEGPKVAAFVSPHGFGHAARSSAVMLEAQRQGGATFELFTTAPRWFFEESLTGGFRHVEVDVDVGFRQRSALHVDLSATVAALERALPFSKSVVARLARQVGDAGCEAVLCDIAPLGIAVAEAAGLPSLLVENFTWGWLYEGYREEAPRLAELGAELDAWAARATVRIQATPACAPDPSLESVEPIGRPPRLERAEARRALGVPEKARLVVVTMGGHAEDLSFLPRLREMAGTHFLVTGAARSSSAANVHLYDNATPLYMPDVLRAADALVAKLGYGTVAEVWREGLPFAHVTRPGFREMVSLEAFVDGASSGFRMTGREFVDGDWIDRIPELVAMPRRPHFGGGARRAAEILLALVRSRESGEGPRQGGAISPSTDR